MPFDDLCWQSLLDVSGLWSSIVSYIPVGCNTPGAFWEMLLEKSQKLLKYYLQTRRHSSHKGEVIYDGIHHLPKMNVSSA